MPVLATESVETKSNDLNEQQTTVQIKDVKDGIYIIEDFHFQRFLF